jgi:hypothetical protein
MTLSLLELGYPNLISFKYMHDQPTSGSKGGCERYRTKEMLDQEARKLQDLHPGFVSIVEKSTKHAWGGGKRTDVICYWKKAFCSKQNERKLFRNG